MTTVPWSRGQPLIWDVTVVDSLSAGRASSNTSATEEAERKKRAKYTEISNNGMIFQPVAFDVHGSYGPETAPFLDNLLGKVSMTTLEPRSKMFFRQSLSVLLQQHNSACILGTVADDSRLEELYML